MIPYISLMRPANGLMSILAVFIGGLIVLNINIFSSSDMWMAMVAAFLIAGGGNAINDYFDVKADKINKPNRPIPSGRVEKRKALAFSIALFIAGTFLAGLINMVVFVIAAVNSLMLVAYSRTLQDKFLLGNVSVSYLVGSTFLFGGAAAGDVVLPLILMMIAFFTNLAREIVKDMEDLEGDRQSFLKRLTTKTKQKLSLTSERFGISSGNPKLKHKNSLVFIAALSVMLAVLISPAPYLLGIFSETYLLMIIPTNLFLLVAFFQIASVESDGKFTRIFGRKNYSRMSKFIKIGMFLGLLAFIFGALA